MFDFYKNFKDDPKMQKAALYSKYSAARINLLLVVIFSVINILTLVTGFGGYFLFTAAIPYQVVKLGMALCGLNSAEYYEQIEAQPIFEKSFIAVFILIALLILSLYLICWIFSKKRADGWLKFALALMSADTMVALLMGDSGTMLVDMLFHIVILILLFSGIGAYKKLRAMPKDEEMIQNDCPENDFSEEIGGDDESYPNSDAENESTYEDT